VAEIAGLTRVEFMRAVSEMRVSPFQGHPRVAEARTRACLSAGSSTLLR
jgi:hypothetical protein